MSGWPVVRRHTARVLIVLVAMGCYSWHSPEQMGPEQLIAQQQPERVRVTVQDQAVITLREPRVGHDTLYGIVIEGTGTLQSGDSVAIAIGHVSRIETEDVDGTTTAVGIASAVLVLGVAAVMIVAANMNFLQD